MAFALANYKCLQSVSDPVCSVWQLAVALHLMPQKASLWNVLGLFISHANGTHKHCRDNVVILCVVAPWSLVGCSLRGCFVLYWVIKLFYSSSCKCVCCEREPVLSPKSWKKSRGFVQIHTDTLQIMAKTRSDFDRKWRTSFLLTRNPYTLSCWEDRSFGGGEILPLQWGCAVLCPPGWLQPSVPGRAASWFHGKCWALPGITGYQFWCNSPHLEDDTIYTISSHLGSVSMVVEGLKAAC